MARRESDATSICAPESRIWQSSSVCRPRALRQPIERMRVTCYAAPLLPGHPTPAGDRRIARLFLEALRRAGHKPSVASRVRSFDGLGEARRQARVAALGQRAAERLIRQWRQRPETAPELWFTYHLYYKAPDWLGPAVSAALGIPYVIAEASYAAKRASGAWASAHRAVERALRQADAVIGLNSADREGVASLLRDPRGWFALPPFLDAAAYPVRQPYSSESPRLIAV